MPDQAGKNFERELQNINNGRRKISKKLCASTKSHVISKLRKDVDIQEGVCYLCKRSQVEKDVKSREIRIEIKKLVMENK